jgi:DNA topoisomerase-1
MSASKPPLIIVDSAAIGDRLRRIVGLDYEVCSTDGQICDLPPQELGIDPNSYLPLFRLTDLGREALKRIRPLLPENSMVYLATETSVTGEALAAHLVSRLRLKHYRRIHLVSLTPEAVNAALGASQPLNFSLVQAHHARRAIDRLIGFTVSRPLGIKLGRKGLSTGRLQAAIMTLLIERERQQEESTRQGTAHVELHFNDAVGTWAAAFLPKGPSSVAALEQAGQAGATFQVSRYASRSLARMPPAPLTTSTLLFDAARRWGYRPEQILAALDNLFLAGAINQPLTYQTTLSKESLKQIAAIAAETDLPLSKGGNHHPVAQVSDAGDEALRPTRFESEVAGENAMEQNLYALIWIRAVQSQLAAATYASQELHLVDRAGHVFVGRARQLTSPGFMGFAHSIGESIEGELDEERIEEGQPIPNQQKGDLLTSLQARLIQEPSTKPGCYTPADLAAELEGLRIGRVDTAYSVLRNMASRGYVQEKRGEVLATDLSRAIHEKLHTHFAYTRLPYLQSLETAFQAVALGRRSYTDLVREFWERLKEQMQEFEADTADPLPRDRALRDCPKCGRPMDLTNGPHGMFWACSGFAGQPSCEYTESR